MAAVLYTSVLAFAFILIVVEATHFRGTTVNWHAVENGSIGEIHMNFKLAWRGSSSEGRCRAADIADQTLLGSPVTWRCLSDNCNQNLFGTFEYICTSFSVSDDWSAGSNSFVQVFPVSDTQKKFVVGNDFDTGTAYDCCWIETTNAEGGNIRFQTTISFVERTDKPPGTLNQSPITDMLPLVPARAGCDFKLIIPNTDPDFDDVKCRWAITNDDPKKDECGAVCGALDKSPFDAILVEEECEVQWFPNKTGLYAVGVQLEDFYSTDTVRANPLSSVPLQFLITVAPATTDCATRPVFPPQRRIPREQPRCFAVADGGSITLEILVGHSNPTLQEVVDGQYVLPRGMNVSSLQDQGNGVKSVTFNWTPDEEQARRPAFFCFVFIDDASAPSDLLCFTIVTSVETPKPDLNTRSPTEANQAPFDFEASIMFDLEVTNPTVSPRFIFVHRFSDQQLIAQIDSSDKAAVTIDADHKTVRFMVKSSQPNIFEKGVKYEITMEEGALVGRSTSCSGGGPVAEGITSGQWTFISAGPPNECVAGTDNCHVNANCIDLPDGFSCVCKDGFSGDGVNACPDINECEAPTLTHDCDSNADCTNTIGNFTCKCNLGYKPDLVATKDPTRPVCIDCNECNDECPENIDEKCHANADCTNIAGSYNCACRNGYEHDGSNKPNNRPVCVNINECLKEETNDCHADADCTDTDGSFTCKCKPGFEGAGKNCVDIDECTRGTHTCHDMALCTNIRGSFNCACKPGYKPDPTSGNAANRPVCIDCNECGGVDCGGHTCHADATCSNTPGSFDCTCKAGYEPDPSSGQAANRPVCIDIDECKQNPNACHEKANCTNTKGSFDCVCMVGYKPDPSSGMPANRPVCINCNECVENDCPTLPRKCHVDATCTDLPGSFECKCNPGFVGNGYNCIDVSNCSDHWPIQRDRWVGEDREWNNGTEECPALGDRLPDPQFTSTNPPIDQWEDLRNNFVNSLEKWLGTASRIPGIKPTVPDLTGLTPDEQWEKLKDFINETLNTWYTQVGEPNGFSRPAGVGDCEDDRIAQWNHFLQVSEDAQKKYADKFGTRCDAPLP